ncbi:MAG: NAD-binding protein [Sphingobacterium sp.]|nr:NAD-binding protein [Sphingobacterium sp.]
MTCTIIPRGKEEFHEGDLAFVISTRDGIDDMMKFSGKRNTQAKSIMVLGGSRIGRHIALNLQHDCQVKLIDYDMEKCRDLAEELEETLVIHGDGRNGDLLAEEGLQHMDAFVAVTGNSETNILSCLLAKKIGVMKTIAEVREHGIHQPCRELGDRHHHQQEDSHRQPHLPPHHEPQRHPGQDDDRHRG